MRRWAKRRRIRSGTMVRSNGAAGWCLSPMAPTVEPIGPEKFADGCWAVRYAHVPLGTFDTQDRFVRLKPGHPSLSRMPENLSE